MLSESERNWRLANRARLPKKKKSAAYQAAYQYLSKLRYVLWHAFEPMTDKYHVSIMIRKSGQHPAVA